VKKIMVIFGTRPEAIKLAPVIRELKTCGSECKTLICITAQHREMLDQVLRLFEITPDYDLDIMHYNQDLFDVTIKSLDGLKRILEVSQPNLVVVQGDTTTTFAASLAAYYCKIPIAHVEAGLRTHNKYQPFPEEKNRHLTTVLADYHFAPTEWAKSNLLRENISEEKVWVTGNTVIDALLFINSRHQKQDVQRHWLNYFKEKWDISLSKNNQKVILVTGHRRESFGEGFKNICLALSEIVERRKDVTIIYPVHLNPNVQAPVKSILGNKSNIRLIEPLEYEPFVFLMNHSCIILTDSGGIQEEAPSLGKPVLVMRNVTERPEGIEAGSVKLVGTNKSEIVSETIELLDNPVSHEKMSKAINPYGDGLAALRIVDIFKAILM
jgi:UDP-N-acetylglucosamine 2-epimerase (non-hydrolysing)